MRVLVVASAPRAQCGIARYAVQQAAALRAEGHQVEHAATNGGEGADHTFDLPARASDAVRLLALARRFDRVILHYQYDLYFPPRYPGNAVAVRNAALAALFRLPGVEIVAHEIPLGMTRPGEMGRKVRWTERWKWSGVRRLAFHTERERRDFLALYPGLEARTSLRAHEQDMTAARTWTREAARAHLGIPSEVRMLLCAGFIQAHKGFDRAMRAFRTVEAPDARLYVVGSVRQPGLDAHLRLLERLAALDPRVSLRVGYQDDVTFDAYLAAADTLVLPYRQIFSSGVAARAHLFGTRVIAANAGGLAEQLKPGDVTFDTFGELEAALQAACAPVPSPVTPVRSGTGLRLAFVAPWYGADAPGGAEALTRNMATRLAATGAQVEILTTRIRDYFGDWSVNARPAGAEQVGGLTVRRFEVEPRDAAAFARVNAKVVQGLAITPAEEQVFLTQMIRSPELIDFIAGSRERYDLFLLGPYMFSTTFEGAAACPGKAVLIPSLHEEGYLKLPVYRRMFEAARGVFFNTDAERDVALSRFALDPERYVVSGTAVDTDWTGDGARHRARHGDAPYLLFVGRKDHDKQLPLLLDHFRRYRDQRWPEGKLVLLGPGRAALRPSDGGSVVDLGFLPEDEKRDAIDGCLALCQPSRLESFSYVLMEAWLAARPVLVHAAGAVTRQHCVQSGGGLYFASYPEFAACVDRLRADPALADRLGRAGRRYVIDRYDASVVTRTHLTALRRWTGAAVATMSGPDERKVAS